MKIGITGDNIISSLGFTTDENVLAVKEGRSGLRYFTDYLDIPEPFMASAIDRMKLEERFAGLGKSGRAYTSFEKMGIVSIAEAVCGKDMDLSDRRTLFVLSTTKGNVALLDPRVNEDFPDDRVYLWKSARIIAEFFGNPNEPLVLSNACISGVVAQIAARRLLQSGMYDRIVVCGVDELSRFVVSGFQSFKALSPERCRPFDAKRCGLNIGEAASTLIFERCPEAKGRVALEAGAITNDANHISGPSRTGEGLFLALQQVMTGTDVSEIGFLNAHGTATLYNDEMESIAFERAGLQQVPLYSLKGYFGHTLGASGVIETVVAVRALQQGFLPQSLGYESCGVTRPVQVVTKFAKREIRQGIKTASGFGGCNAAIRLKLL